MILKVRLSGGGYHAVTASGKPMGKRNGAKLFVLVVVDKDDSEDTHVELWRADDEDDLRDVVKKAYSKSFDDQEIFEAEFDEDWGVYLLPKELGTIVK